MANFLQLSFSDSVFLLAIKLVVEVLQEYRSQYSLGTSGNPHYVGSRKFSRQWLSRRTYHKLNNCGDTQLQVIVLCKPAYQLVLWQYNEIISCIGDGVQTCKAPSLLAIGTRVYRHLMIAQQNCVSYLTLPESQDSGDCAEESADFDDGINEPMSSRNIWEIFIREASKRCPDEIDEARTIENTLDKIKGIITASLSFSDAVRFGGKGICLCPKCDSNNLMEFNDEESFVRCSDCGFEDSPSLIVIYRWHRAIANEVVRKTTEFLEAKRADPAWQASEISEARLQLW